MSGRNAEKKEMPGKPPNQEDHARFDEGILETQTRKGASISFSIKINKFYKLIKILNKYDIFYKLILLLILLVLFFSKVFTFPVSESIYLYWVSSSLNAAVNTFVHTPLYPILLSLSRSIFHDQIFACQLIGILSIYLSSLLVFSIVQKIEDRYNYHKYGKYLLSLFTIAFSPLYNSMFMFDIDNTILLPATLLFVKYYIESIIQKKDNYIWMSLLLITIFWIKEVVVPILFCFIIIVSVLEYKLKVGLQKSFKIIFFSSLISIISFLGVYHLVFNNLLVFEFNYPKLVDRCKHFSLMDTIWRFASFVIWSNLYLLIIPLFNWKDIWEKKELRYIFLLIIIHIITYSVFWPSSGGFPKYYMPVFPLLIILLAVSLDKLFILRNLFFFIFLSIFYYLSGDYLYKIYKIFTTGYIDYNWLFYYGFCYYILPLVVVIILICKKFTPGQFLVILLFAQNIGLLSNQIKADYTTNYHYGDRGINEVFDYIRINKIEDQTLFSLYNCLFTTKNITFSNANYIIDRDYTFIRLKTFPDSKSIIPGYNFSYNDLINNYHLIKRIGNYQIWKRKCEKIYN